MTLGTLQIKMPDGRTREFALEQPGIHAGRASDNELVLDDISVSRRHARLTIEAGQLSIEDLGSANGVFVAGRRLPPHVATPAPTGELFQIGDVELRFQLAAAPPPSPPPEPASSAEAATMILSAPPTIKGEAANRLGTVRVRTPNGPDRDFTVEQATITVGRATDNQLVIDEASISRRHARLTIESSRLMAEDLGSANGTFIGSQRLPPNTPAAVPAEQSVRLGDVELLFIPARRPEAAAASAPTTANATLVGAPAPAPVSVTVTGPAQPVAPGAVVTAAITIHNRGAAADEFAIRVSGVPGNWVTLSKDLVALAPNTQEQISLSFAPPRGVEVAATDHRFTVSVISREHHTGVNVTGLLRVLPYQGFALSLQPVRSRGDFLVIAENQGNAPATYRLRGVDDELALVYGLGQDVVAVAPGQTVSVPLQVTPKVQPRIGSSQVRPFTIVGSAADQAGLEARVDGQLIIRPPVPVWLIPVVLLLALCFCIGLAYAWVTVCPTIQPSMPFCQSGAKPVVNVFTATPNEVDKGGSVVIAWDVSSAETVEFVLPEPKTVGPTGLQTFQVDSSTTFTIKATNFAGSVEKSITVNVRKSPPVIESFSANPGVVTAGQNQKVILSWKVLGATTITIESISTQNFPATGSVEIPAPSANTTYTLVAANESGNVRQEITVVISAADCLVANVPGGEAFNLREGPGGTYAAIVPLTNGVRLDPVGRNATGEWIKVRAAGREGWVPANFVSCSNVPDLSVYPTVAPELIPTLAPTATPTLAPPTAAPLPTGTAPPTNTPPPTETPAPTATPVLASGGLVTYRVQQGGRTSILLQNPGGGPITLIADKDDAEVLDYTPHNGGRFAIWVSEGGAQKIYLVDQAGGQVGNPITGAWNAINDGTWSNDGQRLVVEATTGANVDYFYFDANGAPLGQPALP